MQKNIYAYTAATQKPYPEFISLNKQDDGKIMLHVRGPSRPGQYSDNDECPNSLIELPHRELLKLFDALRDELTPPMMKATGQSI